MIDIYAEFSEKLGGLTPKQATEFNSKRKTGMTIETQLNVIAEVTGTPVTKRVIPKNNGAQTTESFTEGFEGGGDPVSADKQLLVKSYMLTCQISEADARRSLNLPPLEIAGLGRHVIVDYYMHKSGGMSESDAIATAKKGRGQFRR
jgi:hypothetical protein